MASIIPFPRFTFSRYLCTFFYKYRCIKLFFLLQERILWKGIILSGYFLNWEMETALSASSYPLKSLLKALL